MKYLSWDIGIKNLSYCLMDKNKTIISWEIIDISGENKEHFLCKKIQKNNKECNKNALFYNINEFKFYCKTHSKVFQENLIEISKNKCCHKLKDGTICTKKAKFITDKKYIGYCTVHSRNYDKINLNEKKKNSKGLLDNITKILLTELKNRSFLLDVDVILIENQPAFKNPKMKSIQMIIYTYFYMKGCIEIETQEKYINRILFLSASNKLKIKFDNKENLNSKITTTNKYKKNKDLAKLYCLELINDKNWELFFENHKKKDDLADTFLMNYYQIQMDGN